MKQYKPIPRTPQWWLLPAQKKMSSDARKAFWMQFSPDSLKALPWEIIEEHIPAVVVNGKIKWHPDKLDASMVARMGAKMLRSNIVNLSNVLDDRAGKENKKILAVSLPADVYKRLNLGDNGVSFLGSTSEKVLHSATSDRWINVVQYLAPADMAALSFQVMFPEFVAPLVAAYRKAKHPHWRPFQYANDTRIKKWIDEIYSITGSPPPANSKDVARNVSAPDAENKILSLSLCPFASPNCRAVCLNTSGKAGMGKKETVVSAIREKYPDYRIDQATKLIEGTTLADDMRYFFLKGVSPFYGGAYNEVQAKRIQRTHVMWLMFALFGVEHNPYYEMIYREAMAFREFSHKCRIPLALRLNGTSELPVHLWNIQAGNLISELNKRGVVCYDYTKHVAKMSDFSKARSWAGEKTILAGAPGAGRIVRGFPNGYHLTFSWSEVNGDLCLDMLNRGCNVTMVFRQSVEAIAQEDEYRIKRSGRASESYTVSLPDEVDVAQLSRKSISHRPVMVVNGDQTDLRFLDVPERLYKPGKGVVVGLAAKGEATAAKRYTEKIQGALYRAFVLPMRLRKDHMGKIIGVFLKNPGVRGASGAAAGVDPELEKMATSRIGKWIISPTSAAT